MELKVQEKFVTPSKVKVFKILPVPYWKKIKENFGTNNFLAIMKHKRFMGHQSYVLLCTRMNRTF